LVINFYNIIIFYYMSSLRSIVNDKTIKKIMGRDLKTFIIQNKILGTIAGVTIAFSSGTMIRSLVGDIILPTIYLLMSKMGIETFNQLPPVNVASFLKEFVSWGFVIIITFMLIDYIFKKYVWKIK